MYKGTLFVPRGLQGVNHLIQAEVRDSLRNGLKFAAKDVKTIEQVKDLHMLAKLRIPQSIWVPIIENAEVRSISEAIAQVEKFQKWNTVPGLKSFGPRVSISADSVLSSAANKQALLKELSESLKQKGVGDSEFSLRIDQDQRMSLSLNVIPPRPWLDTPMDLTLAEKSVDWWSLKTSGDSDLSRPTQPSESAVKIYRNEASLSCLCSAFLRTSPVVSWMKAPEASELFIWDPFAGNGAMLLELLQMLSDSKPRAQKQITIMANVKSGDTMRTCINRIEKWTTTDGIQTIGESTEPSDQDTSRGRSRKSKRTVREKEEPSKEDVSSKLYSKSFQVGENITANVNLTTVSFQETFPYVSGGIVLSHIPKTYNELTGIDKHLLNEWSAFGGLLKGSPIEQAVFFTETNSFAKYSKLRMGKLVHLVSPNGKSVGHFVKWIPF
jgi:hypothetical protein